VENNGRVGPPALPLAVAGGSALTTSAPQKRSGWEEHIDEAARIAIFTAHRQGGCGGCANQPSPPINIVCPHWYMRWKRPSLPRAQTFLLPATRTQALACSAMGATRTKMHTQAPCPLPRQHTVRATAYVGLADDTYAVENNGRVGPPALPLPVPVACGSVLNTSAPHAMRSAWSKLKRSHRSKCSRHIFDDKAGAVGAPTSPHRLSTSFVRNSACGAGAHCHRGAARRSLPPPTRNQATSFHAKKITTHENALSACTLPHPKEARREPRRTLDSQMTYKL
jgi:hypothetical protein